MSTTTQAPVYEVGRVYEVAPGDLLIGTNVRTDARPDAKDFAASVRSRGVIVAIDAHADEDGRLTVLRGQRRALVAAQVGTPSGTVPVRVVPAPDEADRITDQLVENLHRADMHEREARDGVEQLAPAWGVGRADRQAHRPAPPGGRRRVERRRSSGQQGPDGRGGHDLGAGSDLRRVRGRP